MTSAKVFFMQVNTADYKHLDIDYHAEFFGAMQRQGCWLDGDFEEYLANACVPFIDDAAPVQYATAQRLAERYCRGEGPSVFSLERGALMSTARRRAGITDLSTLQGAFV